jgi:Xaa-Pro aminopeptidase
MGMGKGKSAPYRARTERCQRFLREQSADLLVLSLGPNLYYLSGFHEEPGERPLLLFVPADAEPFFVAPELYRDHLQRDSWIEEIRIWRDVQDPWQLVREAAGARNLRPGKALVDDRMWAMFLLQLQKLFPESEFVPASQVLTPLRMRKAPEEIETLKEAAAIVDEVFMNLLQGSLQGHSELEIAETIEQEMRRLGREGVAFETLVASGPNGALPHHRAGQRRVQDGDLVILDFGCRLRGYNSDITRTVVCGRARGEVRRVYEIVQRAQERAVGAVGPGTPAEEVDRAARSEIEAAGYGEHFIHRTGHGIGLEIHEPPYIVEGNRLPLDVGMTFSVEPGIYLPGRFGVRIEDIVVVTAEGVERLNQSTRELQEV